MQLFPPDDERLSLETCRGGKINTLKKSEKKNSSSWLKNHNHSPDFFAEIDTGTACTNKGRRRYSDKQYSLNDTRIINLVQQRCVQSVSRAVSP
jgi:hypothetical protein